MAPAVMKIYTHKGVIKTSRLRGSLCNDEISLSWCCAFNAVVMTQQISDNETGQRSKKCDGPASLMIHHIVVAICFDMVTMY